MQVMSVNKEEATDEDQVEWYSRRLDAGLSSLQNADYVLAWVCMEDDGVSSPPLGHVRGRINLMSFIGSCTRSDDVETKRSILQNCSQCT